MTMFRERVEVSLCTSHDAGRGLHGHNLRVAVEVRARSLDRAGHLVPMRELERLLWAAVEPWDHRHLEDLPPFRDGAPTTAGALAERVALQLAAALPPEVSIAAVEVSPEPGRWVRWERE